MKAEDKKWLKRWKEYRKALLADSVVEYQTEAEIVKHRAELEANPEAWCKFFFRVYAKADFAPFHKKFIKRILANSEWYEVLSWSRELAKSTTVMFVVMYLVLTGKKRNIILTSNSYDNAQRLLEPYRAQLDSNPLIKAYYGEQKNIGHWEMGEFQTKGGAAFRALGAGQSPRGTRNEEIRPDVILVDDFDTDEECRNPDIIKQKWDWFEQSLYPTRSVSVPLLVIFCGNIIANECCIKKAGELADHWDIINIRDSNGKSTWPAKNSEEQIDRVLSKISTRSAEQEYFNNPVAEGETFKELTYGKIPKLEEFEFLVSYSDPAPSNKDKQKKGTSFKTNVLLGYLDGRYYVVKVFLAQVKNYEFVEWNYAIRDFVGGKTQVFYYIENNTLQNPFYEQVYLPIFEELAQKKGFIGITPDTRGKPDKYVRIEGNLEPLNRLGKLIFNEEQKNDPHMKRLHEQFMLISPQMKAPADGVDGVEGGVYILNSIQSKRGMLLDTISFSEYHKNTY